MGFRVWGFRVQGLGYRFQGSAFGLIERPFWKSLESHDLGYKRGGKLARRNVRIPMEQGP